MKTPLKHKVLRVSWKNFLPTLAKFGATKNIRFFYDYGYNTMYANSVFVDTKNGIKYRIETRAAKNRYCAEFAIQCKSKGYNVYFPMCYSECEDNEIETVAHYLNGNKVNTAIINDWLKKYKV